VCVKYNNHFPFTVSEAERRSGKTERRDGGEETQGNRQGRDRKERWRVRDRGEETDGKRQTGIDMGNRQSGIDRFE
jgi:hypothetical protein